MNINEVTEYAVDGGIGVISVDFPPVNALSAAVRQGVAAAFEKAAADASVDAVVLLCAGRTFFAGADITEFGKPPVSPTLRELQEVVEATPKPVIAAIHGTALGGGLELALVAHYRVAAKSARCGLPEVNIGLLPGAGGTQRLPRLIGVRPALDIIASGRHVPAAEALALGLVDALAEEGALRETALAFARRVAAEGATLRRVRDMGDKLAEADPALFADFRKTNARKFRGFMAPEHCIRAVEAAVSLPFEEGLKEERRLFEELMNGPQSPAQRHAFFAERQAAKVPDIPAETPTRPVERVGVIGAGLMGGGIAMNFLDAGLPVTIVDSSREGLDRGIGLIRKNYESAAKKGRLTMEEVEARMGLLSPALAFDAIGDCDLVIEAVFELFEVKRDVFEALDKAARPGAILASNTSYLDLDAIAAVTGRPESVVGMHFFAPANIMRLLEIVRGEKTDKEVVATAMKLAKKIRKVGVVVRNGYGFVGNRLLAQRQREAEKLILEGALPWDVDRVLYDFGFPMGPFQMRDMGGMDIGWDPKKSSSSTVREILNEMGRFGQKAKAGYYDYDDNRKATPSPVAEKVILDFAASKGIARRPVSDEEILERCLYPMVNEGAKILDEGKAIRASDIDIAWITGFGWPVYRGGPMYWGEKQGLDKILNRLRALEAEHGDDFKPAPLLEKLAEEEKGFAEL